MNLTERTKSITILLCIYFSPYFFLCVLSRNLLVGVPVLMILFLFKRTMSCLNGFKFQPDLTTSFWVIPTYDYVDNVFILLLADVIIKIVFFLSGNKDNHHFIGNELQCKLYNCYLIISLQFSYIFPYTIKDF